MAIGIRLSVYQQRKNILYALQSFSKNTPKGILKRLNILKLYGLFCSKRRLFGFKLTNQFILTIQLFYESKGSISFSNRI